MNLKCISFIFKKPKGYNNYTQVKNCNISIENNDRNKIILPKIHNTNVNQKITTIIKKNSKTEEKTSKDTNDNKILFSEKSKHKDYFQLKFKKKYSIRTEENLGNSIFSSSSNESKTNNNLYKELDYKINETIKNSIPQKISEGQQTDSNIYNYLLTISNSRNNNNIVDNLIIKKNGDDSIKTNNKTLKNRNRVIQMNFRDNCLLLKEKQKKENINFYYKNFNEYKLNLKKFYTTKRNISNKENMNNYKNYNIFDYKKDYKKFMKSINQQNSERHLDNINNVYSNINLKTTKFKNKELLSYDNKIKNDLKNNDINKENLEFSIITNKKINLKKRNKFRLSPLNSLNGILNYNN